MSHLSRRNFLAQTAAAAGAVAVVGQLEHSPVSAASLEGTASSGGWVDESADSEPFVMYIRNAAKGEVILLSGEHEIVYTDRALVGRLQRSMRRGGF